MKAVKKAVQPFKVCLGPLLFIKIPLKTVQLFSKHFPPDPFLCILYFFFHKGKDTSPIPQPSVHRLVYAFRIFFCFYKSFNNSHLSKNLLTNNFFHWSIVFHISTSMTKGSCRFFLEVKQFHVIKTEMFLFYSKW